MGYSRRVVDLFLSLWPFTHLVKRLSPYTPFRQLFAPLVRDEVFKVTFIPVAEEVPALQSTVLPRRLLGELIKASSYRFLHNGCICRNQEGCENYPRELGCLFLGDAAAHLHPSLGHRASVEECLEHVEKAAEHDLVGMIGRIWFDAATLGVMHRLQDFLVVCFCCDCCCLVRTDMKQAGSGFRETIKKLDAVKVEVTEKCQGCGTCADTCFVGAITLEDGRSRIDPEKCKSCGKCSMVCPHQAIQVDFDHEDALWQELLARVQPAIKSPNTR